MRIYGQTRSDRAEKGQGGNHFVETVFTIEHDNKEREEVARTTIKREDTQFSITHTDSAGASYTQSVQIKGKNQHTQTGDI